MRRAGIVHKADVGDYSQVQGLFNATLTTLGVPWILVNNAGVNESGVDVDEMDIDVFERTIRTNLFGTFYGRKANGKTKSREKVLNSRLACIW